MLASDCERSGTCADAEADSGPWWVKVLAVGGMGSIIGFVFWKNRRDAQQQREVSSKLRKLQKDLKVWKPSHVEKNKHHAQQQLLHMHTVRLSIIGCLGASSGAPDSVSNVCVLQW